MRLHLIVHGQELHLLELLVSHCGAAERESVKVIELARIEIRGLDEIGLAAGGTRALRNQIGHGLGVSRAAPINDSDFVHNRCSLHIGCYSVPSAHLLRRAMCARAPLPRAHRPARS